MQLTKNFWLSEFTRSTTAEKYNIDNTPEQEHLINLQALCTAVLQRVRDMYPDNVITITSGYRSLLLNSTIGGSSRSQHKYGEAADFHISGVNLLELAQEIADSQIDFDQMIYEDKGRGSWIHISHKRTGGNRREVLTATFDTGKAVYSKGLPDG